MKCCINKVLDFDGSKISDCDYFGDKIFHAENQGRVCVWIKCNHKQNIDTDIQIYI